MSKYIIAVDQSTAASKVFLLDESGAIVKRFAKNHRQFYPQPGYAEHDAEEIWQNVQEGVAEISQEIPLGDIAALSISNQRETTVLWKKETGMPVCPAVVWQDVRGAALCESLNAHAESVRQRTGLHLSAYFPAAKAASVLRANPEIADAAREGSLCIGTMDSYLVYRLTGGAIFQTDVSNASRMQLMNLEKLSWDEKLCELFAIPLRCLPDIVPSDGGFGHTANNIVAIPPGIPITGVMGDSHAALFGQGCLKRGMAKATYGTGSSVMLNVGERAVLSQNGLSASVGFGFQGKIHYVLEGNITCSGDTLCWLRDEAGMIDDVSEVERIAESVSDTVGVYFIPAFSGLGAPYFAGHARGVLCGMNRGTTKAHIIRAALESMAFQDADVIMAMEKDMGKRLKELRVDGGPTRNQLLMQFQADLLDCPVRTAAQSELSALGVGYMAGIAKGVYENGLEAIPAAQKPGRVYLPEMDEKKRREYLKGWRTALRHCLS